MVKLITLYEIDRFRKRTLRLRKVFLASLAVASAVLPAFSASQVIDVTPELFRAQCVLFLPRIRDNPPGPKWTHYEPIPTEDVLEAVEFEGVVIPFFALQNFQEIEHPYPARAWYQRTDESAIQMFEQIDLSDSTVIGHEYVDAGLVEAPLDAWDFNRRRYGLDPEDLDCSEDLSNESPRAIFSRYLDLMVHVSNILPRGEEAVDVGREDDFILIHKNLFTHFVFADDRKVYTYTFSLMGEELGPYLSQYIWAIENEQIEIVENVYIVAALQYEFTPEENREAAQRSIRILESLLSGVLRDDTN